MEYRTSVRPAVWWVLGVLFLGALLGVAFWLRWQYLHQVGLHVDEFTTLWAARRVQETGGPYMPSGVLYTRGILSTYLTALFVTVGGFNTTVGRSPSLVFGLAAIVAIFLIGRREWNVRVAWLAALGLVLLPEAVVWSSRARFYSQLLFFALLTIWAAFEAIALDGEEGEQQSIKANPSYRAHLLFAGLFVLSLFAQEETILLYPTIVLGMVLWRGWRYMLRGPVLTAQIIVLTFMALRFLVEMLGQPGYFESIQSHKPYLVLLPDLWGTWEVYGRIVAGVRRLPWSLAGLLAIGAALAGLSMAGWRLLRLPRFHQATLFFALQFFAILAMLFTVIGSSWRDPRYLLLVQPFWLLIGAAGVIWLVDRLTPLPWLRWLATGALAIALAWLFWPLTQNILKQEVEGYDVGFAYVAEHILPGDVVMSPQPPACAIVLGRPCDYFVSQRSYAPYVIRRDGVWVDRWSGAGLLNTTAQLQEVIRTAPRVWIVTDGQRLGRRFESDFLRTVIEQFDREFEERGVMALLAQGWRQTPPPTVTKAYDPPLPVGNLRLVGWERGDADPGEKLRMTLLWEKGGAVYVQVNTSLQLVAGDGTRITQVDSAPARNMVATFDFAEVRLPDTKTLELPAGLADGRYRLEVIAYDVVTHSPLADPVAVDWLRIGPPAAAREPMAVQWQNGLTLAGNDGLPAELSAGASIDLRLLWRTTAPLAEDYKVFVHLLGPDGSVVAQSDRAPEDGFYPTSAWTVGEPVADTYRLELPATLPSGPYRLEAGWYQPQTNERPLLVGGSDAVELKQWTMP